MTTDSSPASPYASRITSRVRASRAGKPAWMSPDQVSRSAIALPIWASVGTVARWAWAVPPWPSTRPPPLLGPEGGVHIGHGRLSFRLIHHRTPPYAAVRLTYLHVDQGPARPRRHGGPEAGPLPDGRIDGR